MLTEALTELLDSTIWVSADSNRFHGMPPLIGGTEPDVGWWQISRIFQDVEMRHLELSGFGMFWRCHTGSLQFSSIFQIFHLSSIKSIKGWQNLHWLANHLIKTCCRRCLVSKKCYMFFFLVIKPQKSYNPIWLDDLVQDGYEAYQHAQGPFLGTSGSCVTLLPSAWLGMVKKAPIKIDKIWKNGVTIIIGGKYETIKMENIGFTNGLPHSLCWNVGHHGLLASAPGS